MELTTGFAATRMSQLQPLLEAGREFRAVAKLAGGVLHPEHVAFAAAYI